MKEKYFKLALAVASVQLLSAKSYGQSLDYAALEALFEEPVTLSVTGSPQRASSVPANMEIISHDDIERSGARDIPGVLRHVLGVDIMRWTNNGSDVSIRGYNTPFSPRLLVLINGRQVYADHYGYTHWSSLPVELEEIRQIEVVKGPNSALFGFNALAGVINIVTEHPRYDDLNMLKVQAGTQEHQQITAITTLALGERGAARVSLGTRRNDDFSTPLGILDVGARQGDARDALTIDTHYALRDDVELELEASRVDVGQTDMITSYQLGYQEVVTSSLKGLINADTQFGLIEGTLYRNEFQKDMSIVLPAIRVGSGIRALKQRFNSDVLVGRLQDIFKVGADHTFRITSEYRETSMDIALVGGEVYYDTLATGVMWQWQMTPALALTIAARHDQLDLGRTGGFPVGLRLSDADWDRRIHETTANAGLVWQLSELDTLRLIAGRGAQLPSLYNLGGYLARYEFPPGVGYPFRFAYGSGLPTLDPSIMVSYELAWDRSLPALAAELSVAVYRGRGSDILASSGAAIPTSLIVLSPANIGDSNEKGVEISLKGQFDEEWRWGLSYLNQDIDDHLDPRYPVSQTLINFEKGSPQHTINANLGWNRGPWTVDAYLRYESEHDSFQALGGWGTGMAPMLAINGLMTIDARAAYQFSESVRVDLTVQNLQKDEERHSAGPMVERGVQMSLLFEF